MSANQTQLKSSAKDLIRTLHDRALWKKALRAPDPFLSERPIRPEMKVRTVRQSAGTSVDFKAAFRRKKMRLGAYPFLVTGRCLFNKQSASSKRGQDQTSLQKSVQSLTPLHHSLSCSTPRYLQGSIHVPKAMSGYQTTRLRRKAVQSRSLFSSKAIESFLTRFENRPHPAFHLP